MYIHIYICNVVCIYTHRRTLRSFRTPARGSILPGSLHKWFKIAEEQNGLDPKARPRLENRCS